MTSDKEHDTLKLKLKIGFLTRKEYYGKRAY